jgi:hypothetical protein
VIAMLDALTNEDAARYWCGVVGVPPGNAGHLVAYLGPMAARSPIELAARKAEQARFIALMQLDEATIDRIKRILAFGDMHSDYGRALTAAGLDTDEHIWRLIAESPQRYSPNFNS